MCKYHMLCIFIKIFNMNVISVKGEAKYERHSLYRYPSV